MKGKKRYREVDVFAWEMPGKGEKKKQMMGITHYFFSRFKDGYGFVLWEGREMEGETEKEEGRKKEEGKRERRKKREGKRRKG